MALLCVVVLVKLHGRWHTDLFIWGLALGAVGILNQQVSIHLFPRFAGLTKQDAHLKRQMYGLRYRVNLVTFIVGFATVGVISAKTGIIGLDIFLTVITVVVLVVAWMVAFAAGRRVRRGREADPGQ